MRQVCTVFQQQSVRRNSSFAAERISHEGRMPRGTVLPASEVSGSPEAFSLSFSEGTGHHCPAYSTEAGAWQCISVLCSRDDRQGRMRHRVVILPTIGMCTGLWLAHPSYISRRTRSGAGSYLMTHCRQVKGCVCVLPLPSVTHLGVPGAKERANRVELSPHQHTNMRAAAHLRVPGPEGGFPGCRHRLFATCSNLEPPA